MLRQSSSQRRDSRSWWALIKMTFSAWLADKAPRLGAALAYYTIFSLPSLLIIVMAIAGLVFEPSDVRDQLNAQFAALLGPEGQKAIEAMLAGAQQHEAGIAAAAGIAALFFGAAGVFIQLKDALNTVWEVQLKPRRGIWGTIRDYFLSFTAVLGVGFLLLVLLVISAALTAIVSWFNELVPVPGPVVYAADLAGSFVVAMLLFAMIFRILPDVAIAWRDVWLGAAITSILFNAGKFLIGLYLGRASFVSTYGAAGTILVVLVWAYYSSQILLFGAEFTKVYARSSGDRLRPAEGAEWTGRARAAP